MATQTIDTSPLITALWLVVKTLPFSEEDKTVLLAAVNDRAVAAAKVKQRGYDKAQPPHNRRQLTRRAELQRGYRAKAKAKLAAAAAEAAAATGSR